MKLLADCRLYTFVDTAYLGERSITEVTRQLCDGGSDIIQLRAKRRQESDILKMAQTLSPIAHRAGVYLVINDHPAVAAQLSQPFCHLGQEDFFGRGFSHAAEVGTEGQEFRLGLSTHSPDQAAKAIKAGADYIAVGPVYATPTKPTAKPVTTEYVRWASKNVDIPWFAIGGINHDSIEQVLNAGAQRICIVSAILNAKDIVGTCQTFRNLLRS